MAILEHSSKKCSWEDGQLEMGGDVASFQGKIKTKNSLMERWQTGKKIHKCKNQVLEAKENGWQAQGEELAPEQAPYLSLI